MVGYGNHTLVLKKPMEGELLRKAPQHFLPGDEGGMSGFAGNHRCDPQIELEPTPCGYRIPSGPAKESYGNWPHGEVNRHLNILTRLLGLSQLTGGFRKMTKPPPEAGAAKPSALEDIPDGAEEKAGHHRPLYSGDQAICKLLKSGPWVLLHHRRG